VQIGGVFEKTGSSTSVSQLQTLFCAGAAVRQDGNAYVMHHNVLIVDDAFVTTGSINFSHSGMETNDENLVIIRDPELAAQYEAEFQRQWEIGTNPQDITC
jgi:phosphatidylserine/phosphatidylglycerophosphate/cardiolipin synthase-like enzyme